MEELDIDGLFWLATNPDNKVAGRLKFDSTNAAKLDLIGAFHAPNSFWTVNSHETSNDIERFRIQGEAGERIITLDECFQVGEKWESTGTRRERYHASVVLTGHHFGQDDPLEFSSVLVSLRHLEYWVDKSGVEVECISEEGSNHIGQIHLTHTPVDTLATTTSIGDLELCFGWKVNGDHIVQSTIEQSCCFYLRFTEARSLEYAQKTCSALKELVAIGLDTPSSITEVALELPKSEVVSDSSNLNEKKVRLYAGLKGNSLQEKQRAPHKHDMVFTFDDIGGIDGVARWIEVADRFQIVIGTLMNSWYVPGMSVENRFANAAIAAEALARITVGQNIKFNKGLETLTPFAGQPFKDLVGDTNSWVTRVVKTRNNHVVHTGLRGSVDAPGLYWLSESLYFLVILCLLRECGIAENTLTKIGKHQRFRRVASEIQAMS